MSNKWYVSRDGSTKFGPYDDEQLKEYAASGRVAATDMLWREGTTQWVKANSVEGLVFGSPPPAAPLPPPLPGQARAGSDSKKIAAGICAILVGAFGIHKFILGYTTSGVIMLLVSVLTCGAGAAVMSVIGLVEGIMYLTKTDEEFQRMYIDQKKEWF